MQFLRQKKLWKLARINQYIETRISSIILGNQLSSSSTCYSTNSIAEESPPNVNELLKYIHEDKSPNLNLLTNICKSTDFKILSSEEANLLLKCCGAPISDSPRQSRDNVCQNVYINLVKADKLDSCIYKTYITVCTENDVLINSDQFLATLKCEPDSEILKLLLENSCRKGSVSQAFKLLEEMKNKSFPADQGVFNNLVLASTINGGIESGENVIKTMRSAKISETISTSIALLKGVTIKGVENDFAEISKQIYKVTDSAFLEIIECLGLTGNHLWIKHIRKLYKSLHVTKGFTNDLQKLCIHLVHMDRAESSFRIWVEYADPSGEESYGFFLLDEMIHSQMNISDIVNYAKYLRDNRLNPYILENLTELTLREGFHKQAWVFLKNLPVLRQHYFWPMLCSAQNDENEIFSILQEMQHLNVKLDLEGLDCFVIRYCELTNVKMTINKFQNVGYSLREVISPILMQLLRRNNIKECVNICKSYDEVSLFGEQFIILLSRSWASTKDSVSVTQLLKKYCESKQGKSEFIGEFIIKCLKACGYAFGDFSKLLEEIEKEHLQIHYAKAEILHKLCLKIIDTDTRKGIISKIDSLIEDDLQVENNFIPLTKHMNIEQLECQLIELKEKGLNTRGVLRHLIRLHSGQGNKKRVSELYEQLQSRGFAESPGIKSSVMHNNAMAGNIDGAMSIYRDIKEWYPTFRLDHFKILDLATVLVDSGRFEEAKGVLNGESRNFSGGKSIERNCIALLNSCQNEEQLQWCFNFLTENNCCRISVHVLAPTVEYHIKKGNIERMVETYAECAQKYRCTPIQSKVFSAVLKYENEQLLSRVIEATQNVHGNTICQFVLVTALAENGQGKFLRKLLIQNSIPIDRLMRTQCQKWVQEENLTALKTLAMACQRMPREVLDEEFVNKCVIEAYGIQKRFEEAIKYSESITDDRLSLELEKDLSTMLTKHNYQMPADILRNKK